MWQKILTYKYLFLLKFISEKCLYIQKKNSENKIWLLIYLVKIGSGIYSMPPGFVWKLINLLTINQINPEAVFLRFFVVVFLLFPAGGSNPAGQSLTLN